MSRQRDGVIWRVHMPRRCTGFDEVRSFACGEQLLGAQTSALDWLIYQLFITPLPNQRGVCPARYSGGLN
jgi:hypothetical protein